MRVFLPIAGFPVDVQDCPSTDVPGKFREGIQRNLLKELQGRAVPDDDLRRP